MNEPIVVGITGASGAVYAVRLVEVLLGEGREVHLVISTSGATVIAQELDINLDLNSFSAANILDASIDTNLLRYHHFTDFMAPIASGSFVTGGMVICPCSGSTLSAVAHAAGSNLIQRAAEVHLKERRKLILVPRETPLSLPQINNMKLVTEAGAIVLPASPGWYHGVGAVNDLVDFVVCRILDQLGVKTNLIRRWGGEDRRL
jgi:4-hydroxy-3-polyprenylbenzoate decarboxylase